MAAMSIISSRGPNTRLIWANNFVLADSRCNGKKRDRMAHVDHLARWSERNRDHGGEIVIALKDHVPCDLACTNRIARWAYEQTANAGGLTWLRADDLFPLRPDWRKHLFGFGVESTRVT
jgi:hypothetical protein